LANPLQTKSRSVTMPTSRSGSALEESKAISDFPYLGDGRKASRARSATLRCDRSRASYLSKPQCEGTEFSATKGQDEGQFRTLILGLPTAKPRPKKGSTGPRKAVDPLTPGFLGAIRTGGWAGADRNDHHQPNSP
jgi:hypothetical protein